MLPRDLLEVRRHKGAIEPKYLWDSALAEELIRVFEDYKGKKYKELLEKRGQIEGTNYKLVRGLCVLLERRCEFKPSSKLNSKEIREFLFERGFVITEAERTKLLEQAAAQFGVSPHTFEEAFFSDLQDEQTLFNFNPPTSEELVKQYNLAITQTLLFDALELNFKVEGNYQQIFRQIKYLGLMYEINEKIHIIGPLSLFKQTKKYGTSLAKLLPTILSASKWNISAKIETKVNLEPRILNFELDSASQVPLPCHLEPISHFDSEVEAKFYHAFKSLNSGWEIKREPDFIKAGNSIIIPDFGFYKNGLKHYLEIVGFWTPAYLKKKIAKLRQAEVRITVAVNEDLKCINEDFPNTPIIFYKKEIPLAPITKILRELEATQIENELKRVGTIKIAGDIVPLRQKAQELQILPATLAQAHIPDYYVIGDQLVSKRFLAALKLNLPTEPYAQVDLILRKYNLTTQALDYMGFKIIWKGLKPIKIIPKKH